MVLLSIFAKSSFETFYFFEMVWFEMASSIFFYEWLTGKRFGRFHAVFMIVSGHFSVTYLFCHSFFFFKLLFDADCRFSYFHATIVIKPNQRSEVTYDMAQIEVTLISNQIGGTTIQSKAASAANQHQCCPISISA